MPEETYNEQSPELAAMARSAGIVAANEVMAKTFALLGVNIADYKSMEEFREDLNFIRSLRKNETFPDAVEFAHNLKVSTGRISMAFVFALVAAIAGGIAITVWEGIKQLLMKP